MLDDWEGEIENWEPETPKLIQRLAVIVADMAGAVLVGMMLLTVFDIFARSTGFGSAEFVVELTTMGVVIVASFGIAIITIRSGHVIIDVFTSNNKPATNRKIDAFWLVVMSIFLFTIAYLSFTEGWTLHDYGTTTEVLEWSVLAYYIPPIAGWGLGGLASLWIGLTVFWKE